MGAKRFAISEKRAKGGSADNRSPTGPDDYRTVLQNLQIELVKLQKYFIRCDDKILVLLEGRDATGKDGVIKRIVRHLSPRQFQTLEPKAIDKWKSYSRACNEMFARTHNPIAPWTVVHADDKRLARVNLIKDLLMRLHYDDKDEAALLINPDIIFTYSDVS